MNTVYSVSCKVLDNNSGVTRNLTYNFALLENAISRAINLSMCEDVEDQSVDVINGETGEVLYTYEHGWTAGGLLM